jgi:hypothetical protein
MIDNKFGAVLILSLLSALQFHQKSLELIETSREGLTLSLEIGAVPKILHLQEVISAYELATIMEKGKTLNLETTVRDLLAQSWLKCNYLLIRGVESLTMTMLWSNLRGFELMISTMKLWYITDE